MYKPKIVSLLSKVLWSKAKRLQKIGSTNNFYVYSETIKIKVTENYSPLLITHLDDFKILFPAIDLTPPTDIS